MLLAAVIIAMLLLFAGLILFATDEMKRMCNQDLDELKSVRRSLKEKAQDETSELDIEYPWGA